MKRSIALLIAAVLVLCSQITAWAVAAEDSAGTQRAGDLEIIPPEILVKQKIVYGDTWAQIVTIDGGSASLNGETVPGAFSVREPDGRPNAGEQRVEICFNSADQRYREIPVTVFPEKVTVKQREVGLEWTGTRETYDGTVKAPAAAAVGVLPGDTVTVTVAQGKKDAGTYIALALALDNANYELPAVTWTQYTIEPKSVTVAGLAAESKIYDGTPSARVHVEGAEIRGLVPGDQVTAVFAGDFEAFFDDAAAGSGKRVTVTGVSLEGAQAKNYTLEGGTAWTTGEIRPAPVTVSGITALDKVYDGSTTAALDTAGAVLAGRLGGDEVGVAADGVFETKDSGADKPVIIRNLTLTGREAGNYFLTEEGNQTSAAAEITRKELTVGKGSFQVIKEYDGKTDAGTASGELSLSGVAGEDSVCVKAREENGKRVSDVAVGAYPDSAYGDDYTVEITGIALEGPGAGNYTVPSAIQISGARITKILPRVSGFEVTVPAPSAYDGTAREAVVTGNSAAAGMGAVTVKYARLDGITGVFELDGASAGAPADAGRYQVILSIAEGASYAAADLDTGKTIEITRADRALRIKEGMPEALLLLPGRRSGTLELEYEDLDESAEVSGTLTGDTDAVWRDGNTFTARGNGQVTATTVIGETVNYAAAELAVSVTAITEPAAEIRAVSRDPGGTADAVPLTAVLEGNIIRVTGVKPEGGVIEVTVIPASVGGVTLDVNAPESGRIELRYGGEVIETYTIDESGVTVRPADTDGVTEVRPEAPVVPEGEDVEEHERIRDLEVKDLAASAAEVLLPQAMREAAADGQVQALGGGYAVNASITLDARQKTSRRAGEVLLGLVLDLRPVYSVTAEKEGRTVTVCDKKEYTGGFSGPVTITAAVPGVFAPNYARRTWSGGAEYLPLTVQGRTVAWSQSSFGEVELLSDTRIGRITYLFSDGTVQEVSYTPAGIGRALPADSRSGSVFRGWRIHGAVYETLTEELLTALSGEAAAAEGVFSEQIHPGENPPGENRPGENRPGENRPGENSPGSGSGSSGSGNSSSGSGAGAGLGSVTVKQTANGSVLLSAVQVRRGGTVTVTAIPEDGYEVDAAAVWDGHGNRIRVREGQEANTFLFVMPEGSVTVHVSFRARAEAHRELPFRDVSEGEDCFDAVLWAAGNDITKGAGSGTFAPDGLCTRAQAITLLWRAAGQPVSRGTECPFTDVDPGSYYYDAVLWAAEEGITKGLTDTVFGPGVTVTRGQMAAFLYRGSKASPTAAENPFADVSESSYCRDAVLWAVAGGIVKSVTDTAFAPAAPCTRGQAAAFLYNCFA